MSRERGNADSSYQANVRQRSRSPPRSRVQESAVANARTDRSLVVANLDDCTMQEPPVVVEEPNYGPSGLLSRAQTRNKATLKYHAPPESRHPTSSRWRFFVFEGADQIDTYELSDQATYLLGRDKSVVDFRLEHESCSKQHAVIQFRSVQDPASRRNNSGCSSIVKPYLIDLESTNGTLINKVKIRSKRFYELRHKDVLTFGDSTLREYVVLDADTKQ